MKTPPTNPTPKKKTSERHRTVLGTLPRLARLALGPALQTACGENGASPHGTLWPNYRKLGFHPGLSRKFDILWMDKILHHLRNHGISFFGIYREIIIQGFLRWCRISSTVWGAFGEGQSHMVDTRVQYSWVRVDGCEIHFAHEMKVRFKPERLLRYLRWGIESFQGFRRWCRMSSIHSMGARKPVDQNDLEAAPYRGLGHQPRSAPT